MAGYQVAQARRLRGWSQERLAERLGTTQKQVSRWETGERDIPGNMVLEIADALGVTVAFVLGVTDNPFARAVAGPKHHRPVLGRIAAGTPTEALEVSDEVHEITSELHQEHPHGVWFRVSGNSMNRLFADGSLVYADLDAEVRNGDIGVVMVNGYDATCKRVYIDRGRIRLHPESYDPEYTDTVIDEADPDAPYFRAIGRVVSYTAPRDWRP